MYVLAFIRDAESIAKLCRIAGENGEWTGSKHNRDVCALPSTLQVITDDIICTQYC